MNLYQATWMQGEPLDIPTTISSPWKHQVTNLTSACLPCTVQPLNNRHVATSHFVHFREVAITSEVKKSHYWSTVIHRVLYLNCPLSQRLHVCILFVAALKVVVSTLFVVVCGCVAVRVDTFLHGNILMMMCSHTHWSSVYTCGGIKSRVCCNGLLSA